MTFVLNLLHKDFSLIAADKQGNSNGPVTILSGETKIHITGKSVIEGINKISFNNNKKVAMGFSGNTSAHNYSNNFIGCNTVEESMKCIRSHMESYLNFSERDSLLSGKGEMENSVLMSFFDSEKSAYFTNMCFFTRFGNSTNLAARCNNPVPILCHIGSGSSHFEEAIGLEEINKFINDVANGADLASQLAWFEEVFCKVSSIAQGCGINFDAVLSTRENNEFKFVRGSMA